MPFLKYGVSATGSHLVIFGWGKSAFSEYQNTNLNISEQEQGSVLYLVHL